MFKFFFKKKKEYTTKTGEVISIMTDEDVLLGIKAVLKRTKIDKHHITFLNASIAKKSCRKLKRKGYNVEIFKSDNGCPSFKVSWD